MRLKEREEEFKKQTALKRPDITILGEYKGSNEKLLVKGLCGHEWYTTPNNIRIGIGCPQCFNEQLSKKLTYTNEQFLDKLRKINPHYHPLNDYVKSTEYMNFHCDIHDYTWKMRAGHIKKDSCKLCKMEKKAKDIKNQMINANENIEILSDYVDCWTPIKYRCTIDGTEMQDRAVVLKNGNAECPVCKQKQLDEELLDELFKLIPDLEFVDDFTGLDDSVFVKLKDEPCTWEDTPRNLIKLARKGKFIKNNY